MTASQAILSQAAELHDPAPAQDETAQRSAASPAELAELRLVRRIRRGEERAFRELVGLYQDRVFGLVLRMIGNRQDAEDIAQEVFLTIYRKIESFRADGRLHAWILRIAANTCQNRIKYLKVRHFHRAVQIEGCGSLGDSQPAMRLPSGTPTPETALERDGVGAAVERALAELDPDHRLLVILRDVQGQSYDDILAITGLQEGTLKSRLHRARLALRARLQHVITKEAP